MPLPSRLRSLARRRISRGAPPAFTLVELLIGSALGALVLLMALRVFMGHLGVLNRELWSSQAQRSFSKLSFLLTSEINEGCALSTSQRDTNPASFPYPRSPCTPPFRSSTVNSACDASPGSEFWILVPVLPESNELPDNGSTPNYRSIHYYLDPSDPSRLLRQGPRITASGRLDVSQPDNTDSPGDAPALVLDGVAAFEPVVSSDCRSVAMRVELQVPGWPGSTVARTSRFRTRVKESIN